MEHNTSYNGSLSNSTSKQKFSFSKAQRFLPPVTSMCSQPFYVLPSTREGRAASFGYGNKVEFSVKRVGPPPGLYDVGSEFDRHSLQKKRGFSFGYGRHEVVGGPMEIPKCTKQIPGPGHYSNPPTLTSRTVTLKSRLPDLSNKHNLDIPGPGAYNPPPSISPSGNYISSKYKNSTNNMILSTRHRTEPVDRNPGPDRYETTFDIDPKGQYFLSKLKNSQARIFDKSQRPSIQNKEAAKLPGPGSYKIYSQFS